MPSAKIMTEAQQGLSDIGDEQGVNVCDTLERNDVSTSAMAAGVADEAENERPAWPLTSNGNGGVIANPTTPGLDGLVERSTTTLAPTAPTNKTLRHPPARDMGTLQKPEKVQEMEVSQDCPSDYWNNHIPSSGRNYYLSYPLKVLILKAAFLKIKASHVVDYLLIRGVAFTESRGKWHSLLTYKQTVELVNKRINAAKQAMQGDQKGRNNTEYPLMMAAFEMGKKVLDVEIPECVQLPFFVQWYEEWERDKLGQGQPSFPKRDMLAGENSPTYIKYGGDDEFTKRLKAFRTTILSVLGGERSSDGRKRKTKPGATGQDVQQMNNGQMISYSDRTEQSKIWQDYNTIHREKFPMVTPLLSTDINKFIVESMQDNNFVVEFLQGYLLNVKLKDQKVEPNSKLSDQNEQSDDTKVKKSKKKGSQPSHVDINDLHDEYQQKDIAGCMYFNEKTSSTIVYDKRGLQSSFNDAMNWELVGEKIWNDAPKGLIEQLSQLSASCDGYENMNPQAWLNTSGIMLWASWHRRMPPQQLEEFGIMYFDADTPHAGPCFPDVQRLSYFWLAKRVTVEEYKTLMEIKALKDLEEVKKQSEKSKEDTNSARKSRRKKNNGGSTMEKSIGKSQQTEKYQISKEKFLFTMLEIVMDADDSQLKCREYLTKKLFFAIGESAVYGARDESIEWEGKKKLRDAANAFADMARQVFEQLECHQWKDACRLAVSLDTALHAGCMQVEVYTRTKEISALMKDIPKF